MKQALTTFHAAGGVHVQEGDILPDDHELVQRYASWFGEPDDATASTRPIEAATARPSATRATKSK